MSAQTGHAQMRKVAGAISARVRRTLASASRQAKAEIARCVAEQAEEERKEAEETARCKRSLELRMPRARKGLEKILAAGKSGPIQTIVRSLERLDAPEGPVFFEAHRPSGDVNTRDVAIWFQKDRVQFVYGAFGIEAVVWDLFYDAPLRQAAQRTEGMGGPEPKTSVDYFLREIASPYTPEMSATRHWGQRSFEWAPSEVLFQVLVGCARRGQFDRYLARCAERLEESF